MKKKIIIAIAAILVVAITVLVVVVNLSKPSGDDIFISDIGDDNNDSTTNEQIGTNDTNNNNSNNSSNNDDNTSSIYEDASVSDSLLGGWATSNEDIYEFGNFGVLKVFNSATQEVKECTYKTDGQTYVTITENGTELTYSIKLSTETNEIGDEVQVLVLTKDGSNIVVNKQYEIKKLSDTLY